MRKVIVAGIGQTAFGKFLDRNVRSLAEEALRHAAQDAGIDASRIDAVYFANALSGLITGQETIRGQVALRHTPLMGKPIVNIDNACASICFQPGLVGGRVGTGRCRIGDRS
jgi:acetyl-CoA acyltransferase